MRVLIVEDKNDKLVDVKKLVQSAGGGNCIIHHSLDASDALLKLEKNKYDLMILDICIPYEFSSDNPSVENGFDLLYELNTDIKIFKPGLIIGLTADVDNIDLIKVRFAGEAWSLIEYDVITNVWKQELNKFLKYFKIMSERIYCDIFVCCALDSEAKAVVSLLSDVSSVKVNGLPYMYTSGLFVYKGSRLRVIVGTQSKMGSVVTAIYLTNSLHFISPKSVGMSGILAGIKAELNYGDVVIAEQAWDYNAGKFLELENEGLTFSPDPDPVHIYKENSDTIKSYIDSEETQQLLSFVNSNWTGLKPETMLKIKSGFIASGAAVINSQISLDWIKLQKRKYLALEMEIFGFYKAFQSSGLEIPCVAVKSVADFGDGTKDDSYHSYASHTSAVVLLDFLAKKIT